MLAYIGGLSLIAAVWLVYSTLHVGPADLITVGLLVPVAAAAGRVTVPLPRGGQLMAHTLVYLPAILLLRTSEVFILVFAGTLLAELWARKPWYKVAFNTSQHAISKSVASVVWMWLTGGNLRDAHVLLQNLPWIGLVSALHFLLNAVLMSSVLALEQGGRPWETWRANKSSVLLPQLGVYFLATLVAGAWLYDPRAILLLVVPAAVTWASFRQIRALEANTATEQQLRAESQRLAERWAALASCSQRLGERVDPDAVLRIASELVVEHCADAVRIVAGSRIATATRDGAPPALLEVLAAPDPAAALLPSTRVRRLPLHAGGTDVGTLWAGWATDGPCPEADALLDPLADRVAVALDNALLVEQGAEAETAREVARLKGEFLSAVSHELRSPLALLIGYGELLKERPPGPEEVRWMGERIHRSGEHLARLVDDLLEAGRLESGRFSLDLRPLDALAVISTALETARATYPDHGFVGRLPARAPLVQTDATRLQQVVTNLLANAARYAPAGTEVTVAVEPGAVEIVVAVEDGGPGVPPAERQRVFEKFYRTADAQRTNKKGLGLGLAICRDIVTACGGRIWVEDAPGGGARFAFTLPIAGEA